MDRVRRHAQPPEPQLARRDLQQPIQLRDATSNCYDLQPHTIKTCNLERALAAYHKHCVTSNRPSNPSSNAAEHKPINR